uniref:Polysaccharide biosynthesis protein C-terminal domain-containing protein n=1 Tax=Aegilops tauschii subsp. strangulata TaxID=200361 RepID=A0A453QED2_AEGTS
MFLSYRLCNITTTIAQIRSSGSLYPGTVSIELILLALPAVLGQAIDPMAQLMETAYIGKLGALELASAGIGVAIFNILSKIFNIPLLRIATSFVAEDISKNASKHYTSGKLEMPSVSSALVLAAAIGTIEALALFLGSGLFLKLMGVSPVSPMYASARLFLSLRALGAPANVIMLAVQGIFRGFKDTKTPVLFIGLGNLSAVVLLPLLIYGFKLGITGAAISTIASQYIIAILLMWSLSKRAVLLPPKMDQLEFGGYLKSGESMILLVHWSVVDSWCRLLKKFFRYVSVGLQSVACYWEEPSQFC